MIPVFGFPDMCGGQLCVHMQSLSAPVHIPISGPWIPTVDPAALLDIVIRHVLAQSKAKLPFVQPAAFDGLVITSETDVAAGKV
jgi:hypothetical protein